MLETEKQKRPSKFAAGSLTGFCCCCYINMEIIDRQGARAMNHKPSTQKYHVFTTTWPNNLQPLLFKRNKIPPVWYCKTKELFCSVLVFFSSTNTAGLLWRSAAQLKPRTCSAARAIHDRETVNHIRLCWVLHARARARVCTQSNSF